MKKVYEAHELAYKNLKKKGAESWNEMYSTDEGKDPDHIGINSQRLIEEILEKDWVSKNGKALEIGCGTGHLIRWISNKGFLSTGIDISPTAIKLAKKQSKGLNINFIKEDFCYSKTLENNSFDLIIDGHCFHCIVEKNDRVLFLEKANNLLKKNGVFILFTMCSPIDKKKFPLKYKTQKFRNGIFYVPYNVELEGSKIFEGKMYMAQRKIEHWRDILKSVNNAGFEIKIFKYEKDDAFSSIHIAAIKK